MGETLTIPSEVNVYNIIGESQRPLLTDNAPFCFFNSDDCGNDTALDLTDLDFDLLVTLNGCEYFLGSTLSGELVKGTDSDNNKLWIDIDTLTLDRGQYDYKIYFTDGVSVIGGKLEVR
jgi:hypothetical protein